MMLLLDIIGYIPLTAKKQTDFSMEYSHIAIYTHIYIYITIAITAIYNYCSMDFLEPHPIETVMWFLPPIKILTRQADRILGRVLSGGFPGDGPGFPWKSSMEILHGNPPWKFQGISMGFPCFD